MSSRVCEDTNLLIKNSRRMGLGIDLVIVAGIRAQYAHPCHNSELETLKARNGCLLPLIWPRTFSTNLSTFDLVIQSSKNTFLTKEID